MLRTTRVLHPAPAPPPHRVFSRHFLLCTYYAHMLRNTRFLQRAPAPPHRLSSRHLILCTYCAHMLRTTRFLHPAPAPPPRLFSRHFILCTYCAHLLRTTRFLHRAPAPPPHPPPPPPPRLRALGLLACGRLVKTHARHTQTVNTKDPIPPAEMKPPSMWHWRKEDFPIRDMST